MSDSELIDPGHVEGSISHKVVEDGTFLKILEEIVGIYKESGKRKKDHYSFSEYLFRVSLTDFFNKMLSVNPVKKSTGNELILSQEKLQFQRRKIFRSLIRRSRKKFGFKILPNESRRKRKRGGGQEDNTLQLKVEKLVEIATRIVNYALSIRPIGNFFTSMCGSQWRYDPRIHQIKNDKEANIDPYDFLRITRIIHPGYSSTDIVHVKCGVIVETISADDYDFLKSPSVDIIRRESDAFLATSSSSSEEEEGEENDSKKDEDSTSEEEDESSSDDGWVVKNDDDDDFEGEEEEEEEESEEEEVVVVDDKKGEESESKGEIVEVTKLTKRGYVIKEKRKLNEVKEEQEEVEWDFGGGDGSDSKKEEQEEEEEKPWATEKQKPKKKKKKKKGSKKRKFDQSKFSEGGAIQGNLKVNRTGYIVRLGASEKGMISLEMKTVNKFVVFYQMKFEKNDRFSILPEAEDQYLFEIKKQHHFQKFKGKLKSESVLEMLRELKKGDNQEKNEKEELVLLMLSNISFKNLKKIRKFFEDFGSKDSEGFQMFQELTSKGGDGEFMISIWRIDEEGAWKVYNCERSREGIDVDVFIPFEER